MSILPSNRIACIAATSLCILVPVPARAQAVPTDSAIHAIIATRVDSGRAPGIVVGIVERGRRRYVYHGTAGPGRETLGEHTLFEIGSISKAFTALLLADAVVRGEVRLDQPVASLLPAGTTVPARGDTVITLEHLATHRSGLPRLPSNLAPGNAGDPYADYDVRLLHGFLGQHQLRRAPGTLGEYSNLGAGLLGHALTLNARATSWGALVEKRITRPLGMRETFTVVPLNRRARLSAGHSMARDTVPGWNFDALAGAGALRSSAADMLTFLEAQLDTTRGPLARAAALARHPRAELGPGTRIGLGWIVAGSAEKPLWWHNGGTGGFRSFAGFDPARGVGVVVLANSTASVDDIGMHLLNPAVLIAMPMGASQNRITLPAAELERFVGQYPLSPEFVLSVTRSADTLYVQATNQPRLRLAATAADRFVIVGVDAILAFEIGEQGPARSVTLHQGGRTMTAARRP